MERLTNENHKEFGFCVYTGKKNPYSAPIIIGELSAPPNADYSPNEILVDVFERLAAYEDTMPLERAQELAQAEKDRRLVVLQCKPGQKIWAESPIKGMVYCFDAPEIAWIIENAELFGKEIFLSCEEAEAALKRGRRTMSDREVFETALKTWGTCAQIVMVFEEMSELQKELCKSVRGKDNAEQISEEIADVQIMLEQMIILYNCGDAVKEYRRSKVERLKIRLGIKEADNEAD